MSGSGTDYVVNAYITFDNGSTYPSDAPPTTIDLNNQPGGDPDRGTGAYAQYSDGIPDGNPYLGRPAKLSLLIKREEEPFRSPHEAWYLEYIIISDNYSDPHKYYKNTVERWILPDEVGDGKLFHFGLAEHSLTELEVQKLLSSADKISAIVKINEQSDKTLCSARTDFFSPDVSTSISIKPSMNVGYQKK